MWKEKVQIPQNGALLHDDYMLITCWLWTFYTAPGPPKWDQFSTESVAKDLHAFSFAAYNSTLHTWPAFTATKSQRTVGWRDSFFVMCSVSLCWITHCVSDHMLHTPSAIVKRSLNSLKVWIASPDMEKPLIMSRGWKPFILYKTLCLFLPDMQEEVNRCCSTCYDKISDLLGSTENNRGSNTNDGKFPHFLIVQQVMELSLLSVVWHDSTVLALFRIKS